MKRIIFILSSALLLNHATMQPYPLKKVLETGILASIVIYEVANIWMTSYFCAMPRDYHFTGKEIENTLYNNECPPQYVFTTNVINKPAIAGALLALTYLFISLKNIKNINNYKKFV